MDIIEAKAWLNGERSSCNHFYGQCRSDNAEVLTAQTDAARTQQAYWVMKWTKEME